MPSAGLRRAGHHDGPGISIKLSALHPRYSHAQRERVHGRALPRLKALAPRRARYDIGLNIDAEEADRLELSLDLLERLCSSRARRLDGFGFVVQAYQKRCPFVIDWLIDLARRSGHRLMVRLVKGAYWDSEIKRAQVDGLEGYPGLHPQGPHRRVLPRLRAQAARRDRRGLPAVRDPQRADPGRRSTRIAGPTGRRYEFQCLHGMGETLYEEVVGPRQARRAVPHLRAGRHARDLLAYLVRRLLENGANTSFVNRIADPDCPVDKLLADPVERRGRCQPVGPPHPHRVAARPVRRGARATRRASTSPTSSARVARRGAGQRAPAHLPMLADWPRDGDRATSRCAIRPIPRRVGTVVEATPPSVDAALAAPAQRRGLGCDAAGARAAACGGRRRDGSAMLALIGLIVREAGKTSPMPSARCARRSTSCATTRRRCATGRNDTHGRSASVACISPWNFPLSIFTGQIAARARGRQRVLAKPAEETPLIAAQAVRAAPRGRRAARGAAAPARRRRGRRAAGRRTARSRASCSPARPRRRARSTQLAERLSRDGQPVPLIAETGGQNAMIVDSSALPEQLVGDALTSAFDSRRPALLGAARAVPAGGHRRPRPADAEGRDGGARGSAIPRRLSTDVGPVITAEAQKRLLDHIAAMRAHGPRVTQAAAAGTAPACSCRRRSSRSSRSPSCRARCSARCCTCCAIRARRLDAWSREANATGFGLTFGVHSRIDETIDARHRRSARPATSTSTAP